MNFRLRYTRPFVKTQRNVEVIFYQDLFTLHCIFMHRNHEKHSQNTFYQRRLLPTCIKAKRVFSDNKFTDIKCFHDFIRMFYDLEAQVYERKNV